MATAKPHKYSLERFIRDMEPIMDTVKDRPIADQVESLLDHLMEGAGFLDDTDRTKLGESGFSHIEYVRHIMKTGQTRAQITAGVEPLLKTVRKRRYLGTSRFCPVCESRLQEFG